VGTTDGILPEVNAAYARLFGRTREELTGSNYLDLIPPTDRTEVVNGLQKLSPRHPTNIMTHRVVLSDGKIRWVRWRDHAVFDDQGAVKEVLSFGLDVSEEQNLRDQNERLRRAFDQMQSLARTGSLTWNGASFVSTGQSLIFGSTSADSLVDFQNGLNLGSSGSGQRTIQVNDNIGSTTDIARISGAITNTVAGWGITKTGDGTLELTNTNTYTGATNVNAGTLEIATGGSTHASSAVTVSNSGSTLIVDGTVNGTLVANASTTLSGNGTVSGAATVSGNLNPGSSPGLLTFGSSLALANTTVTTMEIDGTTLGIDYDAIDVGTSLTYDGALSLALLTTFGAGTYTFDLFESGSQSGSFDSITLTNLYSGSLVNDGFGVWSATTNSGSETWTFTQSTGDLTLNVIPEPRAALLCGLSLLLLLRRRR
jgi:PAS domain S-box-containing protein